MERAIAVALLGILLTIWSVYYRRDLERRRREHRAARAAAQENSAAPNHSRKAAA